MSMLIKMRPGSEDEGRLDLLCSLTNLSKNTVDAIKYHLVVGAKIELTAAIFDIQAPNLIWSINKINGKVDLNTGAGIYKCTKCGKRKAEF